MDPLVHLAIIWVAVFVAVVAAKNTRLTSVLYCLFIGCVLANAGVLPPVQAARESLINYLKPLRYDN